MRHNARRQAWLGGGFGYAGPMMSASDLALIALGFLVLFALTAHSTGSILAPAPIWNLMWFFSFITSAVFGQVFYYDSEPMFLLAGVAASFNVGCFLASPSKQRPPRKGGSPTPPDIKLRLTVLCLLISAAGIVTLSKDLGTSIFAIRSFDSLMSLGQQNAVSIFRGEAGLGTISKVAFAVMQVGCALAGAQVRLMRSRKVTAVLVLFLGVAFMWSTITTQRTYLLVPIVWAVGGYVAATCWTGEKVVPPKVLFRGLAAVSTLVFVVVWLRSVRTGGSVDGGAFASSLPWLAGYLPAFSAWYGNGGVILDGDVPGFFGGITGLIGTRADSQSGGNVSIGGGAISNAPTMMRDVFALDGPLLALVVVIALGFLSHLAYRSAQNGTAAGAAMYAGAIAFILWAPNAWFFSYGGRMLAWILLLFAAALLDRRHRLRTAPTRRPPRSRPVSAARARF